MKLTNHDTGLSILIDDELLDRLKEAGRKHYPKEFGGLLIGNYSDDKKTVQIKHTILPRKYKSSRYSFKRGNEGLRSILEHYYSQKPSAYYVGEWHTHPDNRPVPSSTDLRTLQEIVDDENVLITNPILLIIGNGSCEELGFYVFFDRLIYKHEKQE